jgi:cell division septum initiation protein DivIVA
MDILYLIDRLEALIVAGRRVPMTKRVAIDEEALTSLVDQMHAVIPDEIKQSKRILNERERIIENAHAEADDIIKMAKEQADFLLQEKGLLAESQARATRIIQEADDEADHIRVGADEYASNVLNDLEDNLIRHLTQVRNGRAQLNVPRSLNGSSEDATATARRS